MTYLNRLGCRTRGDNHLGLRCRLLIEIAHVLSVLRLVPHRAALLSRQLLDPCNRGERKGIGRVQSARYAVDGVLLGQLGSGGAGGRVEATHLILLLRVLLACKGTATQAIFEHLIGK